MPGMGTRICTDCGKEFTGGNAAKRCPDCRRWYKQTHRRTAERKKTVLHCLLCGREYDGSLSGNSYCPECAEQWMEEQNPKNSNREKKKIDICLPDNLFFVLVMEAAKDQDRDRYVSDWSLSSIWDDREEMDTIPKNRIEMVGKIWDAVHMPFSKIRKASGLTKTAFAARYCIKKRNIENWEYGNRDISVALKLLLEKEVGLFEREQQ